MNLKLQNPKALDSLNMCMSGAHVRIYFVKEEEGEYIYYVSANSYSPGYKIVIEKNITPDKMVMIKSIGLGNSSKENKIYVQLNLVKNKGEFLDWLVKRMETEFLKYKMVL
jgi:chaperonin GroEL (HSP60 family)